MAIVNPTPAPIPTGLIIRINIFITVLSLLLLFPPITTAQLTNQELDAATSALRSHGYNLFSNAIATSDLRLRLLFQNNSFTLFSPPDPFVFSLDLSSPAPLYTLCLLRHVSPSRLPLQDLRNGRGYYYIDSLLPHHRLLIERSLAVVNGTISESVLVDRVPVVKPDLFLGSFLVVHGLEGILGVGVSKLPHPVVSPEIDSPASSQEDDGRVEHARFAKFTH